MFVLSVERTVKHRTRHEMRYEYSFTVDVKPCKNDFVAHFAGLVCRLGRRDDSAFAAQMGVDGAALSKVLKMLTGADVKEWCDVFSCTVGEALLRETDWSIERVAKAAGFSSLNLFCRFWTRKYKCPPRKWRWKS